MKLRLGPILHAENNTDLVRWRFRCTAFVDGNAVAAQGLKLSVLNAVGAPQVSVPRVLADFSGLAADVTGTVVQWTVTLERGPTHRRVQYRIDGLDAPLEVGDVMVPGVGQLPNFAFFSCNGVSEEKLWRSLEAPYACWADLQKQHETSGLQLLIGAGDQLYADVLFDTDEHLKEFAQWKKASKLGQAVPAGFLDRMRSAYARLYIERWGRAEGIGGAIARVPGIYTWDDHDIMDGWGSHEALQASPHLQQMFLAAREMFEVFQLGQNPVAGAAAEVPFFQELAFAGATQDAHVVLLDGRGGRTTDAVLGDAQWSKFNASLAGLRAAHNKPLHLLVVAAIPPVNMVFGKRMERVASVPHLRDDLLDQWESGHHRGERARLLMTLLDAAAERNCAVTILSGDIHVGSRARISSALERHVKGGRPGVIEQLTSSGILHPPPPPFLFGLLVKVAGDQIQDVNPHVKTELLPLPEALFLEQRNWLWGVFDDQGKLHRLWMEFRAEGKSVEPQVVVEAPAVP